MTEHPERRERGGQDGAADHTRADDTRAALVQLMCELVRSAAPAGIGCDLVVLPSWDAGPGPGPTDGDGLARAASNGFAHAMGRVEDVIGEGPRHDVLRAGIRVMASDFSAENVTLWPEFAAAARARRLGALHAEPLRIGPGAPLHGVITFYAEAPRTFAATECAGLTARARIVAQTLDVARCLLDHDVRPADLSAALTARRGPRTPPVTPGDRGVVRNRPRHEPGLRRPTASGRP